ncbi:MAG: hypothetical protein P8Y53_02705 [Pseudolabrys sp.]
MAVAWIAFRSREAVESAARGHGKIDRGAVERLLKELRAGRLVAWGTIDGKALAISPQHWRAVEPTFSRKPFLPGFAEAFGKLVVTVTDGAALRFDRVTISSEAVKEMFRAQGAAIAVPAGIRTRSARGRARLGLRGVFGDKPVPPQSEMNNATLCKQVAEWLKLNKPLPKGSPEISSDSILREAGRKK